MDKPKGLGVPTIYERGAKIAVYGETGTGKTELVMSVTRSAHLLLVDTEGRSQFYNPQQDHGFEVVYSSKVEDAIDLLAYAEELHKKGEKVAFGNDSFSGFWFEQQEVAARAGSTRGGQAKFSSWGIAKRPLKRFYSMLFATPVDCIISMRAKPRYEQDKNTHQVRDYGYNVPDTERGLGYTLDLIVETGKQAKPPGEVLKPEDYWCTVVKTSGPALDNPLPIGTMIKDPSFEKLVALRLAGSANGMDFDSNIGLQVARGTIRTAADFWAWVTGTLKLDEGEVRASLTEVYGPLDARKIADYIEPVWELAHSGAED